MLQYYVNKILNLGISNPNFNLNYCKPFQTLLPEMISNLQQVVAYTPIQAVTTTVKPPKGGLEKSVVNNSKSNLIWFDGIFNAVAKM